MKSPLAQVKEQFGDKLALINKLAEILEQPEGKDKNKLKSKLSRVPNKKLLRLLNHQKVLTEKYGSREALITKVYELCKTKNKSLQESYKQTLKKYSTGRLLDMTKMKN